MKLKTKILICLLIAFYFITATKSQSYIGCDAASISDAYNPQCISSGYCEDYCMQWRPEGDLDCQDQMGDDASCCDRDPNIPKKCDKRCLTGTVDPQCQATGCETKCMAEVSDSDAHLDCQKKDGFPADAKCCDVSPCNGYKGGACYGSIMVDAADVGRDGGECMWSTSEDKSEFMCPEGWSHVKVGDVYCSAQKAGSGGEYQGAITDSMCCCPPMADTCTGRPETGYSPDYLYGNKLDTDLLTNKNNPWYAIINITKYGRVGYPYSYGYDIEYNQFPNSLRNYNPDKFKGFVRIVKACNNGSVQCGWITPVDFETYIEFKEEYCNENDPVMKDKGTAINFSYIPQCARGGEESVPPRVTILMKVDRAYGDRDNKILPPQFLNLTVVPGVYKVIGIDDQNLLDVRRDIATRYEGALTSDTGTQSPMSEAFYDYCTTYVLVRTCDMPFNINVTNMCKNVRLEGKDVKKMYSMQVDEMGFTSCAWELIDGGRFNDHAGVYITVMNKSRHGDNLGLFNYYVNSMSRWGQNHMVNPSSNSAIKEANVNGLLDWNKKAGGRILGCRTDALPIDFWSDMCGPGNFTCTLGAAMAASYKQGFRAGNIKSGLSKKCGYFEHEQPNTSIIPGQTADYFQYNDLDDENGDDDPFNNGDENKERYDDKAFDYESGVPDRTDIVNQSIESIETNIEALFVKTDSVQWKGMEYRKDLGMGGCLPGTDTSKKYIQIPWGKGEYDTSGKWINGNWYGGTTYSYIYKKAFFNYSSYPAVTSWPWVSGWPLNYVFDQLYDKKTCSNPIVYFNNARNISYFSPAATDRYWITNPSDQDDKYADMQCTRPAHSGDKSTSAEPLYYSNPGGYAEPGDSYGIRVNPFNTGDTSALLSYYRQFNKRTLWVNVFKITPEFHNKPPNDDLCAEETKGGNGGLGAGQGDCDENCAANLCASGLKCTDKSICCPANQMVTIDSSHQCCATDAYEIDPRDCSANDYCPMPGYVCIPFYGIGGSKTCIKITNPSKCATCQSAPDPGDPAGICQSCSRDQGSGLTCDSDACEPGLNCDFSGGWGDDFCCPKGTSWDRTIKCCMRCGVYTVDLYDYDYCSEKVNAGSNCKCGEAEGGCSDDSECATGLKCLDNPYDWSWTGSGDNGCCPAGSTFVGDGCMPTSIMQANTKIYTRTGGGVGGGPIFFHFAGGGNLPNETEAGGNYNAIDYCKKVLGKSDCGLWGILSGGDNARVYGENSWWSTDVCSKSWAYMRDQGGIWDEQKNLGDDKKRRVDVQNDVWAKTGRNPSRATVCALVDYNTPYWCTSAEGCNCYPNEPLMLQTIPGEGAGWIWKLRGDSRTRNPNWQCEATQEATTDIPKSCGSMCRKMVKTDEYLKPVTSLFNYTIKENNVVKKKGSIGGGTNVLPVESPWNFLHVGDSLIQHSLEDSTNNMEIDLSYTAQHKLIRQPLAQTCVWYGCTIEQACDWWDLYDICEDSTSPEPGGRLDCKNSPCGDCDDWPGYPRINWFEKTRCDGNGNCWRVRCSTYWRTVTCSRCFGAWHQWPCNYPVSDEKTDGGYNKQRPEVWEEVNDTSTVYARPYGKELALSKPLENDDNNPHVNINVMGFIDYDFGNKTDPMDFRNNKVNGSLTISAKSSKNEQQKDLLGGFELQIPDTIKVVFTAKEYPPIHDLYILDSTANKELIMLNSKMQEMMQMKPCSGNILRYKLKSGTVDINYGNNYVHYIINPMKKYYYAAQGKGEARAFFSAIGEKYSWDLKPICKSDSYIDYSKTNIGLLRNFHEDESKYWDFVGFYPEIKPLNSTSKTALGSNPAASETYSTKKTEEDEVDLDTVVSFNYATNEYTFNFSTRSIDTEKFKNAKLRIYSDFRYIEVYPFKVEKGSNAGTPLSCTNDYIRETIGAVEKEVRMRHPVELDAKKVSEDDTTVTIRITGIDLCNNQAITSGYAYLKFQMPYAKDYTASYSMSSDITITKKSRNILFTAVYLGNSPRAAAGTTAKESGSEQQTMNAVKTAGGPGDHAATDPKQIRITTNYKDSIDYVVENLTILVIVFIALMSYRFFTTRRLDIQDMWDEWKGKK